MKKTPYPRLTRFLQSLGPAILLLLCARLPGQTATPPQQLVFAGLRSAAQQGEITAVQTDSAGNLYLLLNQGDGVRLLKTDSAGNAVLAQALLGTRGDVGVALALDPTGNVYATGTTTSSALAGTPGAAIPSRTDASTNSFVAKFDSGLNPVFVTFTGGSRIAASALSATADAVFVTGTMYAANLPVTSNGIQQAPAYGSSQNGFVERFSSDGTTLVYATYLTGANGDTTPAAIVADATDAVYLAGATSATGYPTVSALVPESLGIPSGFLTKLTPAGDGITFSTYVPGAGLTSIALDSTGQTLLASGSVAPGQFPVDTVTVPLVPATYQVLLRIPVDGSSVESSTLIAPAAQSFVAAGPGGSAWVDSVLTAPLLPLPALSALGNGFAAHVPAGAPIDLAARFGGLPNQSPTYASLPATITSVAVEPTGEALIAGAIQPTASSSLLASETYDLPLRNAPTPALPSAISDAKLSAVACSGSLCPGSAAYLAKLSPSAATALAFSADDLPVIVLRNLGSAETDNLQLAATGSTLATNCPPTLYAGGECDVLLSGGLAGTLTATSSARTQAISFPAYASTAATGIVYSPKELDFGIVTANNLSATRTITVINLGTSSQTFTSALDAASNPKQTTTSPFSEVASDCTLAGAATLKVLAPGGTCHVTIGLTAYSTAANDGFLNADWSIGSRDVALTGYSQAASLGVSSTEVDFGTQYRNGLRLPRFVYLSNASPLPVSHGTVTLPAGSPFTVTDGCPAVMPAGTVCRIRLDYLSSSSTSTDSTTLTLDAGLSVLITGKTLPPQTATGSTVNPNLSVTPTSATFGNAVAVTGISSGTETVTISNSGASPFALALSLTGDFTDSTSCGATLAGGQSCSAVVSFTPSQPGTRQGLLSVTAGTGSPAYVSLSGSGTPILPANNGTLDSGSVPIGQPVTQFYKVSQSFSSLTASATGPYTVVLVEDLGFGHGTPSSGSYASTATGSCRNCWLGIEFQPTAAGTQSGTLTLTSTPQGSPYVLGLTGTGLPLTGLVLTPLSADFGSIPVNSTGGSQFFTLSNLLTSGAAAVVGSPTVTGDFVLSSAATGTQSCGGTLAYSASCIVAVAFAPTASGNRTGTLTLSASGATVSATLAGTGTSDPGIAIAPLALTFANVPAASATVQTISVTNTGSAPVQVGNPTVATGSFHLASACGALAPNAMCSITVTFLPGPAIVSDTLSIPVTTTGGTPATTTYTVSLSGSYTSAGAGLEIVPASAQFGPVAVGQQTPGRQFTVNNLTAKTLALNIAVPRNFALSGAPCTALAANASCTFSLEFAPLTNGDIPGTITAQGVPSDGSAALNSMGYVEGYGTGAGTLTITGGLIVGGVFNFGQVTSGQIVSQVFTLSNLNPAGSAAITVRRITSNPPFLSTTTCGSALAVGQSCTVTVSYAPSNQVATGTISAPLSTDAGILTIESDAGSAPDIIDLSGQGTPIAVTNPANAAPLATFALSQASLTFSATPVGGVSPAQQVTLTNTGTVTIHITSVFTTADFSVQSMCATLVAGATCTISVTATPQTAGIHLASLEIASDSATSLDFVSLLVNAAPSPLTLSPASLTFGAVLTGMSATLPVQVTNNGAVPIIFGSIAATGDYSAAGTCPAGGSALAVGASCTINVTFSPTASGTRTGTLSVATSASANPLTVPLTGTGAQPALTVSATALAFGSVPQGSSASASLTLLNNGAGPITNLSITAGGDFAVTVPCAVTTLAAGSSCAVQVTFTPAALGARTASLTITSSDPGSPISIPLSGTGIQGGSFTITADGGPVAGAAVTSGTAATYQLTITPTGGFTGTVALTCTPVLAAQYASCSILPSTVTLANGAQTSVVTINTITSMGAVVPLDPASEALQAAFFCLLFPGLLTVWKGRHNLRRRRMLLLALLFTGCSMFSLGCGGAGGHSNTLNSPAGAYQYQITGSSTSGVPATQTVTLNLTVNGG